MREDVLGAAVVALCEFHDALQLIFQAAKGGPRKINRLCTEGLLVGSLEQKDVIGPNLLKRVIRDLEGLL